MVASQPACFEEISITCFFPSLVLSLQRYQKLGLLVLYLDVYDVIKVLEVHNMSVRCITSSAFRNKNNCTCRAFCHQKLGNIVIFIVCVCYTCRKGCSSFNKHFRAVNYTGHPGLKHSGTVFLIISQSGHTTIVTTFTII